MPAKKKATKKEPAARKPRQLRCEYCGKAPDVTQTKSGLFWMICPRCGWKSKLFGSEEAALEWYRHEYDPREGVTVRKIENAVVEGADAFILFGKGWQSRVFQTPEHALYWLHHHWGRPLKTAIAPPRISVKEREPPPDDPVADLRDLQQSAYDEALGAFDESGK